MGLAGTAAATAAGAGAAAGAGGGDDDGDDDDGVNRYVSLQGVIHRFTVGL